jgi:hypothetical protein
MAERNRTTGRQRHRGKNNIEKDLELLGWEDTDWITCITTGTNEGICKHVNEASASLKFEGRS